MPLNSDLKKHIYASLLAAYARGSVIRADGTGLCSDYNAIESLDGVVLYD